MNIKEISWEKVEEKIGSVSPVRVEIREPRNSHDWELTKIIERADVKIRLELGEKDEVKGIVLELYKRSVF